MELSGIKVKIYIDIQMVNKIRNIGEINGGCNEKDLGKIEKII